MDTFNHTPHTTDGEILSDRNPRKFFVIGLLVVIVCAALVAVGFMYHTSNQQTPHTINEEETPESAPLDALNENEQYIEAILLLEDDRGDDALNILLELMDSSLAEDPETQAMLAYRMAQAQEQNQPYNAVDLFKEVAANENNGSSLRAYSVQSIGMVYENSPSEELFDYIFADEPYAEFVTENELDSLMNLYEYASSIQVLALSELEIASRHAEVIRDAVGTEEFEAIRDERFPIITERLSNYESVAEDVDDGVALYLREQYTKALVYARLAASGFEYDYEKAMQDALNDATEFGSVLDEAPVRFAYAMNLHIYEIDRNEDVIELLEVIVENIDRMDDMQSIFTEVKATDDKQYIVEIATYYPAFKNTLLALGWTEADFM